MLTKDEAVLDLVGTLVEKGVIRIYQRLSKGFSVLLVFRDVNSKTIEDRLDVSLCLAVYL